MRLLPICLHFFSYGEGGELLFGQETLRTYMTNSNTSHKLAYKLSATGLFAIFAMMVIPGSIFGGGAAADSTETGQISVYGMLDLVQKDASGNTLISQTVHNLITDEGETYLLNQAFDTATASVGDTVRMGAICVTSVSTGLDETSTATEMSAGSPGGKKLQSIF